MCGRTWAALGGRQRPGGSCLSSREPGGWGGGAHTLSLQLLAHVVPPPQFLQFRMKIINLKLERFRDRVEFSGNPSKYDVSVTLRNVQLEDAGTYNCYIMNPPDRHRGHGKIYLQVLMEGEWWAERAADCPGAPACPPSHPPAGGSPRSLGGAVPS